MTPVLFEPLVPFFARSDSGALAAIHTFELGTFIVKASLNGWGERRALPYNIVSDDPVFQVT
jgi:hypothetical protein